MTPLDFDFVRDLLRQHTAIALDADKQYLVEARLAPIARRLRLRSVAELIGRLRAGPGDDLRTKVVEALATAETSFFRDLHPFEALRDVVIPDLMDRRRSERRLNVWCAGCASGQEPYSLAILLQEHFPELAGWTVSLLASDFSRDVLARARQGLYNQVEIHRGLPAHLRAKYFHAHGAGWQLRAEVRDRVEFRQINLARPWPALPPMDLVLLRNVMLYFDVETKKAILARLAGVLRADGYLLLGGAETTLNLDDSYRRVEPLRSSFYRRVR